MTPKVAMIAAVGWGIAATALLFKLCNAGAHEKACNDRRDAIRNLSKSADPADQAKAQSLKTRVGAKLGHDYSLAANKTSARMALALSVLVLAGATFFMRSHQGDAEGAPAAAPVQQQPVALRTV